MRKLFCNASEKLNDRALELLKTLYSVIVQHTRVGIDVLQIEGTRYFIERDVFLMNDAKVGLNKSQPVIIGKDYHVIAPLDKKLKKFRRLERVAGAETIQELLILWMVWESPYAVNYNFFYVTEFAKRKRTGVKNIY